MRAPESFKIASLTLAIRNPQDGITQPATYVESGKIRSEAATLTVLSRPNGSDPLSTRTTLEMVLPFVVVSGEKREVKLNRIKVDISIDKDSPIELIDLIPTVLKGAIEDAGLVKAFKGERLV